MLSLAQVISKIYLSKSNFHLSQTIGQRFWCTCTSLVHKTKQPINWKYSQNKMARVAGSPYSPISPRSHHPTPLCDFSWHLQSSMVQGYSYIKYKSSLLQCGSVLRCDPPAGYNFSPHKQAIWQRFFGCWSVWRILISQVNLHIGDNCLNPKQRKQ